MKDEKKARIRWTKEEKNLLVKQIVSMMTTNKKLRLTPRVLEQAMTTLPVDRRRRIVSLQSIPWLEVEVSRYLQKSKVPTEVPSKIVPTIWEELAKMLIASIQNPILERIEQLEFQVERLTLSVRATIAPEISNDPTTLHKKVNAAVPRIAVVGLLPQQEKIVLEQLGETPLEITFIEKDMTNLKDAVRYCDHVYLMINFLSHRHTEMVGKVMPKHRITNFRGGLGNLIEVIQNKAMKVRQG